MMMDCLAPSLPCLRIGKISSFVNLVSLITSKISGTTLSTFLSSTEQDTARTGIHASERLSGEYTSVTIFKEPRSLRTARCNSRTVFLVVGKFMSKSVNKPTAGKCLIVIPASEK